MRFLMLYRPADTKGAESGAPPCQAEMSAMGQFIEESSKAGILLATEGCQPSAKGARVRQANGGHIVTDGPFTEAKELIAGFALVQLNSKAEAIEYAKKFLAIAGDGETEIRQVHEMTDFAALDSPEFRTQGGH